ncbi:MAG TPA: ribosomal L7Ae/L30e/S12e/Gadd45 family protein [Candidatus Pelethenecus faecipullorum]|uniref:Ribosomal L7Ae/L30e/S12e/Gadd45 family protein n=1 Tax=Candidatus Pelethenecus faecipullorum TaxID=2840900 RepID=A0A9D1GQ75_9MOLU|nr:ribosomal L7Ae/L30e/S12e/Gadd45 family protein [Candidatus Pelethenecus faecipullorum]
MERRLSNLGLCQRASGLISGEELVLEGLRSNRIFYIFLASDASENTKKRILDKAKFYHVEVDESYSCNQLSQAIGKENRMTIGITNPGFLKILKK